MISKKIRVPTQEFLTAAHQPRSYTFELQKIINLVKKLFQMLQLGKRGPNFQLPDENFELTSSNYNMPRLIIRKTIRGCEWPQLKLILQILNFDKLESPTKERLVYALRIWSQKNFALCFLFNFCFCILVSQECTDSNMHSFC